MGRLGRAGTGHDVWHKDKGTFRGRTVRDNVVSVGRRFLHNNSFHRRATALPNRLLNQCGLRWDENVSLSIGIDGSAGRTFLWCSHNHNTARLHICSGQCDAHLLDLAQGRGVATIGMDIRSPG